MEDSPAITEGEYQKPPRERKAKPIVNKDLLLQSCVYRSEDKRREWCSPCSGYLLVYKCTHFDCECSIGKAPASGIRSCNGCPAKQAPTKHLTSAVGVITAHRKEPTLSRTIDSLKAAGWTDVHVFDDGGSADITQSITVRKPSSGAWSNWWLALQELIIRNPDAKYLLLCEDDGLMAVGSRDHVEQLGIIKTECVVSLYLSARYDYTETARFEGGKAFIGAVALLITRPAVDRMLSTGLARQSGNIDSVVGQWCQAHDVPLWVLSPGLVQHIGETSTLGHTEKPSRNVVADVRSISQQRSQPIRVGFLAVAYMPIGGTETWHRTMLSMLASLPSITVAGFVTTWLTGGDTSGFGCPVGHGIEAASELARNVDVLIEWGVDKLGDVLPAANRPRVLSIHHGDASSMWSREMIERRTHITDQFVCVHSHVAQVLREQGLDAIYLPNAVRDQSIPRTKSTIPTVVWLGRYSQEKRPLLVVEIAKYMPDVTFRFVGSGAQLADLQRASRGLENVVLAPPVSSPWEELASADVLLSTSDQEGFGYSMAEAMLAGVPVVATPCGIAEDERLCTQVAIDAHLIDWMLAIRAALDSPAASQLDFARKFVLSEHSPANIIHLWESVIQCQPRH